MSPKENENRIREIENVRNSGFLPPNPLCIENARIFLEGLERLGRRGETKQQGGFGELEPDVFPTPCGGLTFEWGNEFFDACFETGPDGGSGCFSMVFTDGTPGVFFETSLSGGGMELIVAELRRAFEAYGLPGGDGER